MSLFPELDPPHAAPPSRGRRGTLRAIDDHNPCAGCPREAARKVAPTRGPEPQLAVVGLAPNAVDEAKGLPFAPTSPAGVVLRAALRKAGVDPDRQVAYLNLARCRPDSDNVETVSWKEAEKRCGRFLARDLASLQVPLLLLGARPLQRLMGNTKAKLGSFRGLWFKTVDGREAFLARHPGSILGVADVDLRDQLVRQFEQDIQRMVARLHGTEVASALTITTVTTLPQLALVARKLAALARWWAFDIESYDGARFPSRKEVATDPCHPDFRVRGVGIAWSAGTGMYLELAPLAAQRDQVRALLSPAFGSQADKAAFNGHFDEEGLVVPGWIDAVVNRRKDGMLAMVALGDGTHESLKLEKAVVDILGKTQMWSEADKSQMRDLPLEVVARGAVSDACRTYELCEVLEARLARGEYL